MLMGVLLHREGYAVSLLHFEPEKHMALGIQVDEGGYKDLGYAFVETTGFNYVSEVPAEFVGGIVLESIPIILRFGNEIENPMPNYSAEALADVQRILDVRDRAEAAADRKFRYIERTPMSRAQFNYQRSLYEACFVAMNRFEDVLPCEDGTTNTDFMDRADAIKWINRNAWWE